MHRNRIVAGLRLVGASGLNRNDYTKSKGIRSVSRSRHRAAASSVRPAARVFSDYREGENEIRTEKKRDCEPLHRPKLKFFANNSRDSNAELPGKGQKIRRDEHYAARKCDILNRDYFITSPYSRSCRLVLYRCFGVLRPLELARICKDVCRSASRRPAMVDL